MAESLRDVQPVSSPVGEMTAALMYEFLERHEGLVERRKALTRDSKKFNEEIEKLGCPLKSWQSFVRNREESGVIRQKIDAGYRELMAFDRKPLAVQPTLGLGADGQPLPPTVAELKRVDLEGHGAGKGGRKKTENPYTPGTEEFQRWDAAWLRGQSEIASTLTDDAGKKRDAKAAGGTGRPRGRPRKQPTLTTIEGGGGQPA